MQVLYADIFSDVSPPSMSSMVAGEIQQGVFYPSGSVARHFWSQQQQHNEDQSSELNQDVYIIQAVPSMAVKIGIAVDTDKRLASLQTANHEELIVIKVFAGGGAKLESELHQRFKHLSIRGEWFIFSDEMLKG